MLGVTGPIPYALGFANAGAALYSPTTFAADYAINGIPFLSGATENFPYQRSTAPYRKQQFDAAVDVGEQSLVTWWLRSQSTWHGGAGQTWYDSAATQDPNQPTRFLSSVGIDPWTIGEIKLQKATYLNLSCSATTGTSPVVADFDSSVNTIIEPFITNSGPAYFQVGGTQMWSVGANGGIARINYNSGTTSSILSVTQDGSNYYVADATSIHKGPLDNSAAGAVLWNTGSSSVCIAWVKGRLMAGIGPSIYELVGGSPPTLPSPKFTHQNPNWVWTSIVAMPEAIYASGYAPGGQSSLYKFVLASDGSVPVLSSGITAYDSPIGEVIYTVATSMGQYFALGLSNGVRIGDISTTTGDVQVGPHLFFTTNPVKAICAQGQYFYAGVSDEINNMSGLFRVDMSTQIAFARYAWASDLQTHVSGNVTGVALFGTDRLVIMVDGAGSYLSHPTNLETSGSLFTSQIRYSTADVKLFKFLKLRGLLNGGSVGATIIDPSGASWPLGTIATEDQNGDIPDLSISLGPVDFVQIELTLNASTTNAANGPSVSMWQTKALPAEKRQRQEQVPLLCFDWETDRSGQRVGGDGYSWHRLSQIEGLEEAANSIQFQHFTAGVGELSRLVVIDQLQFVQVAAPTRMNGWGGILIATLRSIT